MSLLLRLRGHDLLRYVPFFLECVFKKEKKFFIILLIIIYFSQKRCSKTNECSKQFVELHNKRGIPLNFAHNLFNIFFFQLIFVCCTSTHAIDKLYAKKFVVHGFARYIPVFTRPICWREIKVYSL